jgi:aryl-alcohol dehydrogenase-like predicted oxidoreductase
MDVLDVMNDLRREGLVRSFGAEHFPPALLREAEESGLKLDNYQSTFNVVDQRPWMESHRFLQDTGIPMSALSPLAGGLLSDACYKLEGQNLLNPGKKLNPAQQTHMKTIRQWAAGADDNKSRQRQLDPWTLFGSTVLKVLADISQKYQEPMSAVAMRYILQKQVKDGIGGGVVIKSAVGRVDRSLSYRHLFTFELDEDDLDRIEYAASKGCFPGQQETLNEDGSTAEESLSNMMNDKRLWL